MKLTLLIRCFNQIVESSEDQEVRLTLLEQVKEEFGLEIQDSVKNNSNQFSFIERANQSTLFDSEDRESQTDPPPM